MKQVIGVLLVLILVIAVWVAIHRTGKGAQTVFPSANVLLITIDTIRPDHLSCYGSKNPTPNLDEIAGKGILFENAFTHVPLTFPSHTAILTGLFPAHHGAHQNGLDIFTRKEFLISKLFHQNGYKTAAIVSSFVLDRRFGLSDGFDTYDDQMERLPGIGSNFEVERPGNEVYDHAIRTLESFRGNKWFIWLHFYDPHTPYAPPSPLEGYDGEIVFVDQQIGKLHTWLKDQKMDQNMIWMILGDHGESLGEHGEATHGFFVYNSTLKIPMMLSYPGCQANLRVQSPAAAVDVVPTLTQLTGVHDTQTRDGESLLGLVQNNSRKLDIFFESRYPQLMGWNVLQGLVHADWKLISTTRSELYDWKQDASESTNLYSQKEEVSAALKKALESISNTAPTASQQPDSETLEKLRSLGYISTTNIAAKQGTADPKDKIVIWGDYERSLQLRNAGQKDEARRILTALTEMEPANNFFRISLASGLREVGDASGAIQQLETAVRTDPSDSNVYHELALAHKEMRNYPEAIQAEEAALALQPNRAEYISLKGILLVETGQFQRAIIEFDRVLKIDQNNAVVWNNYGNALRETGEIDKAAAAYRKAIELSPHYAYPQNGLGTILVRQDRTREAIPYFEKALDLDPKYVEVYLNLGIAFDTLHETEKAKTLYRSFLRLAPDWMEQERHNAQILLARLK